MWNAINLLLSIIILSKYNVVISFIFTNGHVSKLVTINNCQIIYVLFQYVVVTDSI